MDVNLRHFLRRSSININQENLDTLFLVLLDTGCSVACSGFESDFCGELARGNFGTIKTADGMAQIEGFGILHWTVTDVHGETLVLRIPGYYAPTVEMRLCSPQDYARYYEMDYDFTFSGNAHGMQMCHEDVIMSNWLTIEAM